MKIANAGQWVTTTLRAPGLADLIGPSDLTALCTFAKAVADHEITQLRSGIVIPNLSFEQWKLAVALARDTRDLLDGRAGGCRQQLSATLGTLTDLGRAHQFNP
jgi:hypothetical protein